MAQEEKFHFQGIGPMSASADGGSLLIKTVDAEGNSYGIAVPANEASKIVAEVLLASIQANHNRGKSRDKTTAISVYDVKVIEQKASNQTCLAVTFERGTAPLGLLFAPTALASLAHDILLLLDPSLLANPRSLTDKKLDS